MRTRALAVGVAVLTLAVVGLSPALALPSDDEPPQWLLAHHSSAATFDKVSPGTYRLTLSGADPNVLAFTDRPERVGAVVPLRALVRDWTTLFGDDPPNAAITDDKGRGGFIPLTLSRPRFRGDDLLLDAAVVANDQGDVVRTPPARINGANTFVDGVVADDNFEINYSLDGDYAKFTLKLAPKQNWMGMCFATTTYPSDCVYTYDGAGTASPG
jgi:hypothetical protein